MKTMFMKTTSTSNRGVIVSALLTGSVCAWAQTVNPNGFPSGPHYNLNLIGKKADYNCTPVQIDEYGNPVYGNVVFLPETGQDIQILIKSGRKGGKASELYTEFRVTDACAGFDGNPAVVELPPNGKGYRVYARALAKPVGTDWTLSYGGSLFSAQDEYGNDLIDLGLVTPDGTGVTGEPVVLQRNKGKSVGVDITPLFLWSGSVCTINFAEPPLQTDPMDPVNYRPLCWIDNDLDGFDTDDSFSQPVLGLGGYECSEGTGTLIWVKVACIEYVNEWIFNIAELVASDWLVDNEGTKLVQLRFYPVQ